MLVEQLGRDARRELDEQHEIVSWETTLNDDARFFDVSLRQFARSYDERVRNEEGQRAFWAHADSTDSIDWSKASKETLPRLRPTLRTISIRLPEGMVAELKRLANKRDVPYQSLLKVFLAERIHDELGRRPSRRS